MKKYLTGMTVAGILLYAGSSYAAMDMNHSHNTKFMNEKVLKDEQFKVPLVLPPLLKGEKVGDKRVFNLEAQQGEWEFLEGYKTQTLGYNSPILGSVLNINRGEETQINIKNSLSEVTTVHWHGGILSQDVDGVHNAEIQPGKTKGVDFTLNQPASTLWFHPHPMHKTAKQVYKGLAGLIYLEDEVSQKLDIPRDYGVNDFPIVLQDKKLDKNGQLDYTANHMEKMHGKSGGFLLVNGKPSPYVKVPYGIVRFRVLNGSNATNYDIDLGGQVFYQISSDGGFLKESVKLTRLELAPGERAEILIDTKDFKGPSHLNVNGNKALEIQRDGKVGKIVKVPQKLVDVPEVTYDPKIKTRTFTLKTEMRGGNTINNTPYNMDKLNFKVNKGTEEIWEIKNGSASMDMPHPFHVHGAQFRIIERNGKVPPLNEQGWKDTVNLKAGDNVKILIKYTTDGITVYHCHILEHEEDGMMGQFKIQ